MRKSKGFELMKKRHISAAVFLVLLLISATAAVPRLLTVQGRLKEAGAAVSGKYGGCRCFN